jgi:hypothetical protein
MRRELPELVIPFSLSDQRAQLSLEEWSRGVWFRPSELRPDVLLGHLRRYYLPLWLVDSDVEGEWQAEMGFDYQAASFREEYQSGQWVSKEITETRIRWEPRVGRLNRHYDNVVVPALRDHKHWMSRLGGYDFGTRKAYASRDVVQSIVRVPDQEPEEAWIDAESALYQAASLECKAASNADHVRNWGMRAQFKNPNWTQMLVPAYLTYYQEADENYPVWINGQSGHVYGVKVHSQQKAVIASLVLGAIAAFLFLIGIPLTLIGVGIVLIVLGLLVGLLAPVPAIWVWLHNRRLRQERTKT